MRAAIIGGSFDPVHIGHLFLAEELRRELGYERVIFVPANLPPHKHSGNAAPAEQRLAMLKLAAAPFDSYAVEEVEIARGGISYTVDTIPSILERYSISGQPGLVIGDDLVEGFPEWKEHERLAGMVDIVIAHRSFENRVQFPYSHHYLDNLVLPLSSSDIRARVADGRAFRHIVPDAVFDYIHRYMLYRQRD